MFESDDDFFDKNEVSGLSGSRPQVDQQFAPWHKPRKQWMRDKQWWKFLRDLLISRGYKDIGTIIYFGLPGGDLLDVEFFHDRLIGEAGQEGKSGLIHGFVGNKKDKETADSRMPLLLDKPNIHSLSRIDRFNFGSLHRANSESWSRLKELGPYHLVNLDFCDCVFKSETLNAMHLLMDYQLKRNHGIPWIFCLTTRVDRQGVNADLFDKLDVVLTGLDDDDVIDKIKECFDSACQIIDGGAGLSSDEICDQEFTELIQVCVVLWVVTYSLAHESSVKLVSSIKYRVRERNNFPDMLSFVFRLEKKDQAVADQTGVAGVADNAVEIPLDRKIQLKISAIAKLARSPDVDHILDQNVDLKRLYAEQMKELLGNCGWDVSNYYESVCPEIVG